MTRFSQDQINVVINGFVAEPLKLQITINETDHSTVLKLKDANGTIQDSGDANSATQ